MPLRADRLRDSRERKGIKQRELSQLCGVTEFQISRYENGKSEPGASVLELIARSLDVSTDYLLGLSDQPTGQFGEGLFPDQQKLLEAYEAGDGPGMLELVTARLRQVAEEKSG